MTSRACVADIQVLKRIYRRLATYQAAAPKGLAEQRAWLIERFTNQATDADAGNPEITGTKYKGQESTMQLRGSTAEERAAALELALTEIDAEIAAADAGEDPPVPCGALLPRVVSAPR